MNYKGFYRRSVFNTLINSLVWAGLSTYVIISKSYLGTSYIPVFESVLFISGLLASRYISYNKLSFKYVSLVDILLELICLIAIFTITFIYNVGIESAVSLYVFIIISNGVLMIFINESRRDLEDSELKTKQSKKFLKTCRGRHRDMSMVGLSIGSVLSMILLSYFNIDLKAYALLLIFLSFISALYQGYLIKKYLFN